MNTLKWLVAGVAVGVIAVAFRDFENDRWLLPVGGERGLEPEEEEEEPVLGYDGMDVDTLLDWLNDAALDDNALLRMRDYEERHLGREPILAAIDDRL